MHKVVVHRPCVDDMYYQYIIYAQIKKSSHVHLIVMIVGDQDPRYG